MTRVNRLLSNGAVQILLMAVALFWLLPVFVLFVQSLRDSNAIANSGWWTALGNPSSLIIDNYQALLNNPDITRSFWNTVYITVPSTILVVLIAAGAAYALSWIKFPGRDAVLLLVVGLLVVPLQIALIPLARLFGDIGLFGTIPGVVLFHVGFGLPFAIFLLRNFFSQFPGELLEAARVDGASDLNIFIRLVLPLGLPAIASLAIFQFLWTWNDMLVALIFTNPQSMPLTVAIQTQLRQYGANLDVLSSGAFLSMIVPLIVFFAFQRYFVQALLAGSQK